jgi:hypothetical protein
MSLPVSKDNPCCETMGRQLNYDCQEHGLKCPDIAVSAATYGTDNIFYLNAPNATYSCWYCPWCGTKLPEEPDWDSIETNDH